MKMLYKKTTLAIVAAGILMTGCSQVAPEEKASKGLALLAQDDLRGAEIALKSALAEAPTLTRARLGLAKLALRKSDYDAALNELDKVPASASDDDRERADMLRAYAYSMSDNPAILTMDDHGYPMIMYYQFKEHLKSGDEGAADEVLTRLRAFEGGFSDLAGWVDEFANTQEPALLSAVVEAESMAEMAKGGAENVAYDDAGTGALEDARLNLGIQMAGALKDVEVLTGLLETYHQRHPGDSTRRLEYADMLIMTGEHEKAKSVISPLLESYPENGMLNRMRAIIAYEQKEYDTVESSALLAAAANPSDPLPRLLMAYSAFAQEDPQEALENLELVIDDLPATHPAQRLYLQLNAMSGDLADAADRSLKLGDLTENDASMLTSLGMALLRQGDEERARELAEKVESINPNGEGATGLGLLQLSLDDDRAMATLKSAFDADPTSLIAGQSFAAALLKEGNYADAMALAKQWQEEGQKAEGKMLEATVYSLRGDDDAALAAYEVAYNESPDSIRSAAGYLNSLVLAGKDAQAKDVLRAAIEREQYGLYRFYVGAYRSLNGQDGVTAAADTLAAIIGDDGDAPAQLLLPLAQSYFIAERQDEAYRWLQKMDGKTKDPAYFLMASAIERQRGDSDAALSTLADWQEASPANPMPLMGRVRLHIEEGTLDAALSALDAFIERADQATPASLIRGHVLAMMRRWDAVHNAYVNLTSEQQKSPLGKALLGINQVRKGNLAQAERSLEPLMKATPDNVYLPFYITALESRGKMQEAADFLASVTSASPDNRYAWFLLANNAAVREDYTQADQAFAKILSDETPSVVLNNYAYVKLQMGDVSEAEALSERAVSMSPNTPAFVETLASIYLAQGDAQKAYGVMKPIVDSGVEVNPQFMETFERTKSQ